MHVSRPARLVGGLVTLVLSTGALSLPAQAAPVSAQATPRIGAWDNYSDGDFEAMAQRVCLPGVDALDRARPVLDDLAYATSGENVEAVLVSARVDRDGALDDDSELDLDASCTFAVIATAADTGEKYLNEIAGSYSLTVSSPVDAPVRIDATIYNVATTYTTPVFTDVEEWVTASLTSNGSHQTRRDETLLSPGRDRTAGEIQRAKKLYDLRVKQFKKEYTKAKKKASTVKNKKKRAAAKKKAKKTYDSRIAGTKRNYVGMIAPIPTTSRVRTVTAATPYSLSVHL